MKHLHKKNNWFYYVRKSGNKTKWIALHTQSREEALRLWAELEASKTLNPKKGDIEGLKMTLQAYSGRFLEQIKEKGREATSRAYKRAISSLQREFGDDRIRDIDRQALIKYHAAMSNRPYEANLHMRVMGAILQSALDQGVINSNPAYRLKKYKETKIKLRLTVDILFNKIYTGADTMLKRAIMLAFHLGGQHEHEIKTLKWTDFDMGLSTVSFIRQKTGEIININFSENPALIRFLAQVQAERKQGMEFSRFLVHSQGNQFKTFRRLWERALRRAGLQGFMFKEIRHLANTILKDAGIDVSKRMAMTGHMSIATNERYTHRSGIETIEAGKVLGNTNSKISG